MTDYYLGKEIYKEMCRQGMTPDDLAKAICRGRRTVDELFRQRHLSSGLLTSISLELKHDFFSDLAREYLCKDEAEMRERVVALMPYDELHTFSPGFALDEMVKDFLSRQRTRPLVVFCSPTEIETSDYALMSRIEEIAYRMQNLSSEPYEGCEPRYSDSGFPYLSRCGNMRTLVMKERNYGKAIMMAEGMSQRLKRQVILYIPVRNSLRAGLDGGLIYEDVADELFAAWRGRAHFAYVPDIHTAMIRELYHAYRRRGTIDRLIDRLNEGEEIDQQHVDMILEQSILDIEQISEKDSDEMSRIRIFYKGTDNLSEELKRMMYDNGINDNPRLDMWLEFRNDLLIDYQYNRRTQNTKAED